jgi:type VI secretion system protein ImpL
LRLKFYARCKEVAYETAIKAALADLENYRTIEESFDDNLLSRFPFSRTSGPPVDPAALSKFFKDFDLKEKAAREALNRAETFGADPKPATQFLDQVAKVRGFFAPFLEKNQGPIFDFKLQFRVPAEPVGQKEIGGNQIIDWKLEVGNKKFAYLNDDLTGRWVYGDPIRLTLRWANDSPVRPKASAVPNPFVVKERTAIFEYNDPWSLFTLVLRHGLMLRRAGTPAECSQGFDPDPYTLKFTIRTEADPAGPPVQDEELKRSPAEVFMRMSMLSAKPDPLMLPCFPTKAPRVPSLYPDKVKTATNKD